jgi:hypothetical protein
MITERQIRRFYKHARKAEVLKDSRYEFSDVKTAVEYVNDQYCYLNEKIETIKDFFLWYGFFREWTMTDKPTILLVDDHYVQINARIDDEELYIVDLETGELHLRYGPLGYIIYESDWAKGPYRR